MLCNLDCVWQAGSSSTLNPSSGMSRHRHSISQHLTASVHPCTTYYVGFVHQVTTYDRLRTGWFSVLVTSYPDKIHEALAASLAVLRDVGVSSITPRELMRAKRTLLTRWGGRRGS
jgi:hypothetical protein